MCSALVPTASFQHTEKLLLSNDIHDYYFVSQGKTEIPGLDDGEELEATDVSTTPTRQEYSSSPWVPSTHTHHQARPPTLKQDHALARTAPPTHPPTRENHTPTHNLPRLGKPYCRFCTLALPKPKSKLE